MLGGICRVYPGCVHGGIYPGGVYLPTVPGGVYLPTVPGWYPPYCTRVVSSLLYRAGYARMYRAGYARMYRAGYTLRDLPCTSGCPFVYLRVSLSARFSQECGSP